MTLAALQALVTAGAGFALFRLWRAALPEELWLRRVVAAGFLVRAFVGQLLFWIGWAQLPLLPRLQSGNGIWFFALDATGYFARAAAASADGLTAIARLPRADPAVVYVQLLALATWLFGAVTSTGLLVNLFCYLGCVALLRRWTSSAIAITALSLSPSFVLWSLQPLKESLFQLLVVAFVCACAAWQRAWTQPPRWRNVAATAVMLALVLAALSGVRWYVAVVLFGVTLPFLLAVALPVRPRKGIALAAAAAVALLLSRALLAGGGSQVPPPIVELLTPSTSFAAMAELPSLIGSQLGGARDALEVQGGGTVIQPTRKRLPASPPPAPPPVASDEAQIRATIARIVDGWNGGDAAGAAASFDDAPDIDVWNDGERIAAGPAEVRALYATRAASAGEEAVAVTDVRVVIGGGTALATGRWQRQLGGDRYDGTFTFALHLTANGWRVKRQIAEAMKVAPAPSDPTRVATAAAAMLLPRVIGQALGLFHIPGGRGFLWLTDVDTLAFDVALCLAIVVISTRFRAALRDPLVWMLTAFTLLIGIALAYSVTNFGTLFRLRETVYLGVILVPAAAMARAPGSRRVSKSQSLKDRGEHTL